LKERYRNDIGFTDRGTVSTGKCWIISSWAHAGPGGNRDGGGPLAGGKPRERIREDHPARDDQNFLAHSMATLATGGEPLISTRPVTITRFQPKERKY
jgi:hypothetical protein